MPELQCIDPVQAVPQGCGPEQIIMPEADEQQHSDFAALEPRGPAMAGVNPTAMRAQIRQWSPHLRLDLHCG